MQADLQLEQRLDPLAGLVAPQHPEQLRHSLAFHDPGHYPKDRQRVRLGRESRCYCLIVATRDHPDHVREKRRRSAFQLIEVHCRDGCHVPRNRLGQSLTEGPARLGRDHRDRLPVVSATVAALAVATVLLATRIRTLRATASRPTPLSRYGSRETRPAGPAGDNPPQREVRLRVEDPEEDDDDGEVDEAQEDRGDGDDHAADRDDDEPRPLAALTRSHHEQVGEDVPAVQAGDRQQVQDAPPQVDEDQIVGDDEKRVALRKPGPDDHDREGHRNPDQGARQADQDRLARRQDEARNRQPAHSP